MVELWKQGMIAIIKFAFFCVGAMIIDNYINEIINKKTSTISAIFCFSVIYLFFN